MGKVMRSPVMRALGLMSGTSLDGIDAALITTDGENFLARGPSLTLPYDAAMRKCLTSAIAEAKLLQDRTARTPSLASAEHAVTQHAIAAVSELLRKHALRSEDVDVIGFHGQTVLHRPDAQLTVQLGDGQALADGTRRSVVCDLRAADMAAGGQGAPLVPIYHQALTANLTQRPLAIVNIGGVANVTFIGRDSRLIAFDTGPGNALIDDWMMKRANLAYDDAGQAALRGRVQDNVVRFYLNHSYFSKAPPKSLDRNAFVCDLVDGLSVDDGAATLAALTAGAIAKAREHLPEEPALWIIAGGGRRNKAIMRGLAGLVQNAVVPAETASLSGDSLEAEAWAYLAVRSVRGLPITFPGTTGVPSPMTGGVLITPRKYLN